MRTIITLVTAAALMAAPTMANAASAALAPASSERANAELQDSNGFSGKSWVFALAIASMGILAVLVSKDSLKGRPVSP